MAALDKNKFIDLKKFIEQPVTTSQRLLSLKVPRDLKLKQPKKNFTPNLKAFRNKEKPKEFNKKDEKTKDKFRNRSQHESNKDNTRFVQSSGVFSEGVGNDHVRLRSWVGVRGEKEYDSAPVISMPTIKKSFQVNKKDEDIIFNKITGCDEESDDEKLPFQPISWQNRLQKPTLLQNEIKIENDVIHNLQKVKLEPGTYNPLILTSNEYLEEDKLSNDTPSMSLWGLPDSFAGKGFSDDPDCKKLFDYCLSDMQEGQIGKIVIRKSGRREIHMGQMLYELESGESDSYKEDIVSLESQENSSQINSAILGNIKNRYFLSPDWDRLLL